MNIGLVIICETLVTTIVGSLLHFTYQWSKENKIVGIFAAVNESTWEHVKLALSGILLCTLVDIWFLGDNPNYWLARSLSLLAPVIIIPVLFYGYQGFTKKSILPLDIGCFVIASLVSSLVFVYILQQPPVSSTGGIVGMLFGLIIMVMYLLLTVFPPHTWLFRDPVDGKYGYAAYKPLKLKKKRKKSK